VAPEHIFAFDFNLHCSTKGFHGDIGPHCKVALDLDLLAWTSYLLAQTRLRFDCDHSDCLFHTGLFCRVAPDFILAVTVAQLVQFNSKQYCDQLDSCSETGFHTGRFCRVAPEFDLFNFLNQP
jgi:hypothetical protein